MRINNGFFRSDPTRYETILRFHSHVGEKKMESDFKTRLGPPSKATYLTVLIGLIFSNLSHAAVVFYLYGRFHGGKIDLAMPLFVKWCVVVIIIGLGFLCTLEIWRRQDIKLKLGYFMLYLGASLVFLNTGFFVNSLIVQVIYGFIMWSIVVAAWFLYRHANFN